MRWVLAIAILGLVGCEKPSKCWKGIGDEVAEIRTPGPFTKIYIEEDHYDVYIYQDTFCSITLEGGDKMIPWMETEVKNGSLIIRDKNTCRFMRNLSYKTDVHVTVQDLELIEYRGTGNIYFMDTLVTDTFELNASTGSGDAHVLVNATQVIVNNHTGPFDVYVAGSASQLYLYSAGNGFLNSFDMDAVNVNCTNYGTGDLSFRVSGYMFAHITHTGNIVYKGVPALYDIIDTGSGEVINAN